MASSNVTTLPERPYRTTSSSNLNRNIPSHQASPVESRRASAMAPPPMTSDSSLPNSPRLPHTFMQRSSSSQGHEQGPLRHPKPLTAADLHLELEKEQESIVNRLTRELSALRAQTASVASTASSTSDLFTTSQSASDYHYPPSTFHPGSGASIIPTSSRRHRSSSNLSMRSARSVRDAVARDAATTSVSGVAAPRDNERSHQTSARQSLDIQRPETSRQNSYSIGLSSSTSTGNMGMYRSPSSATSPYGQSHRTTTSASQSRDASSQAQSAAQALSMMRNRSRSPSFGSAQAAARYEEAAVQRQEMEAVKRENEVLKQRIRDLEKQLLSDARASHSSTPVSSGI